MNEGDVSKNVEQPKEIESRELDAAQAQDVAGGDGDCGATATIGTGGISVTGPAGGIGDTIIETYEGMIQATSYAIERVVDSLGN